MDLGAGSVPRWPFTATRWSESPVGVVASRLGDDDPARIEPTASQRGWRNIVQRQTDVGFLTAGSVPDVSGLLVNGNLAVLLIMLAAAWFAIELLVNAGSWPGPGRRWWPAAIGLVLAGCALDAVHPRRHDVRRVSSSPCGSRSRPARPRKVVTLTTVVSAWPIMALTDLRGAADRLGTGQGSVSRPWRSVGCW